MLLHELAALSLFLLAAQISCLDSPRTRSEETEAGRGVTEERTSIASSTTLMHVNLKSHQMIALFLTLTLAGGQVQTTETDSVTQGDLMGGLYMDKVFIKSTLKVFRRALLPMFSVLNRTKNI